MTSRLRNESGQAVLMTVMFLTVLLGAAALVTDVGGWYRQQRQAQATADAAALAGAQALPSDPAQAQVLAAQYATSNGGGVLPLTAGRGQSIAVIGSDAGSYALMERTRALAATRPHTHTFVNLDAVTYWSLLGQVDAMVGNSSSGIVLISTPLIVILPCCGS